MFALAADWVGIFFNKRIDVRRSGPRRYHLVDNFAIFGYPDGSFDVAPLWEMSESEFTLI
jgi:hypothetical protein